MSPGIEIVKSAIDVGVQTNDWPGHEAFWSDVVSLTYDHLLKVGGGVHQHRYDLHGAVLKINAHRDPLPDTATGFVGMATVRPPGCEAAHPAATPDGTPVHLLDAGTDDVATIVRMEATDRSATVAAWIDGLGAQDHELGARIGETVIEVVEVTDRPATHRRDGVGIRYLTVQVADVRAAHAHALDNGLTEGLAPVRLGDVAFISFVRLPDGDWIELSQRASLTGPLPDDAPRT